MGALPTTDLPGYKVLRYRIIAAFSLLQEAPSVDFKKASTWNDLKKGIPKDILAMSNLRDGGIIIIGVSEKNGKWKITGMKDTEIETYNADNILDHVNKYASPSITFDVVKHKDDNNRGFLVIQVHEFEERPIVCKRNYENELREGAFYIRPLFGKAESREIHNENEMHDLLELAADKSARKFFQRCERLKIITRVSEEGLSKETLDSDKFGAELEGL